jgi:hypothetical protein
MPWKQILNSFIRNNLERNLADSKAMRTMAQFTVYYYTRLNDWYHDKLNGPDDALNRGKTFWKFFKENLQKEIESKKR